LRRRVLHPSTVYPLTLGPPRKIGLPSDSLRLFAFFFRSLVFLRLTLKPSTFPSAFTRRSATSRRLSSKNSWRKKKTKKASTRCPRFRRQSPPHRRASTRPDRVKFRWRSEFQGTCKKRHCRIETAPPDSALRLFLGRSAPASSSSNPAETVRATPIYSVLSLSSLPLRAGRVTVFCF
jgi:hypothetical protein